MRVMDEMGDRPGRGVGGGAATAINSCFYLANGRHGGLIIDHIFLAMSSCRFAGGDWRLAEGDVAATPWPLASLP